MYFGVKMLQITYLTEYPFSIAFGGKEVQMKSYEDYINCNDHGFKVTKLDYWEKNAFDDVAIIHIFGFTNWYYNLISAIKAKNQNVKIVISPTHYYTNKVKIFIASRLYKLCILPNYITYKKFILDNSDTIIVNSESEMKQYVKYFGKHLKNKIAIIPNA